MLYILIPFALLGLLVCLSILIGWVGTRRHKKKDEPNTHSNSELKFYRGDRFRHLN